MEVIGVSAVWEVGGVEDLSAVSCGVWSHGGTFVVAGTASGKVLWANVEEKYDGSGVIGGGGGGEVLEAVEEVTVGVREVTQVLVAPLSRERRIVTVLCDGKVSLLEVPSLRPTLGDVETVVANLTEGAQAVAVRQLVHAASSSGRTSGGDLHSDANVLQICAAVATQVLLFEIEPESESVQLLSQLDIGLRAQKVTFGGPQSRSIFASTSSRHIHLRVESSPEGGSIGVAADIQAPQDRSRDGAGSGLSEHRPRTSRDEAPNALLSALTLGLAGGGGPHHQHGSPRGSGGGGGGARLRPIAVPLTGERWLLQNGADDVGVFSAFGACEGSARELGFGEPWAAAQCYGGAAVIVNAVTGASDAVDVLGTGGRTALPIQTLQLPELPATARKRRSGGGGARRWAMEPPVETATSSVAAVLFWRNSACVALLELRLERAEAVSALDVAGELKLALALCEDRRDDDVANNLRERLARIALLQGQHHEALEYLRRSGHQPQEILRFRNETVPVSWKQPENIGAWAELLFRARKRGAAAVEPDRDTDEAILETLCLAERDESLIVSLLLLRHAISPDRGEELLRSPTRTPFLSTEARERALVTLFRSTREHARALHLIERSAYGTSATEEIAAYLRDVDDDKVIFDHLPFLLRKNATLAPEDTAAATSVAIEVLTDAPIDVAKKIRFARRQSNAFLVAYVKSALGRRGGAEEDLKALQNALIAAICEELGRASTSSSSPPSATTAAGTSDPASLSSASSSDVPSRAALLDKLAKSLQPRVRDPPFVLEQLPRELWRQRADLLRALGRHSEAMATIAMDGGEPDEAESYGLSLPKEARREAMTALAGSYLASLPRSDSNPARSAELVRRAARILSLTAARPTDAIAALERAPPESTDVGTVRQLLTSTLSLATSQSRAERAQHALLKTETLRKRDSVLQQRGRSIRVGPEDICSVCRRRIGDSVFLVTNDGALVHYGCYRGDRSSITAPNLTSTAL